MTETELEQLLSQYKDDLGTCRPAASNPKRNRIIWRLAITASLALALGGAILWPRQASAAITLRKVGLAIRNAHTLEFTLSMLRPSGKWVQSVHGYYKDGKWRSQVQKSASMAMVIIENGGKKLTEYRSLDHATIRPLSSSEDPDQEPSSTGVELVTKQMNSGMTSTEAVPSVRTHQPVNGRATYLLVLDRNPDRYHCEILVDQATDLPLEADESVDYSKSGSNLAGVQHIRGVYQFGKPLSDELFTLKSDKPIIDLPKAQGDLASKWRKPIAIQSRVRVLDACSTPDGTVWITSLPSAEDDQILPGILNSDGAIYLRARDLVPASMTPEGMRVSGRPVTVSEFVPLDPTHPQPTAVRMWLTKRPAVDPQNWPVESAEVQIEGQVIHLALRKEPSQFPNYFAALELDWTTFGLPQGMWELRARKREAESDILGAAKAYEQCAAEAEKFIKYSAYGPLLKAARCYRLSGNVEYASILEKRSELLKASQER